MKKLVYITLLIMLFAFSGCMNSDNDNTEQNISQEVKENLPPLPPSYDGPELSE